MTSKELDNCPFCGSEHILEALQKPVGASEYFMIKCFDCSAEITRTSRRKAVAAWNRRDGTVIHSGWILNPDGSATCQNCHRHSLNAWDYDSWLRYCPDCGAKMVDAKPNKRCE